MLKPNNIIMKTIIINVIHIITLQEHIAYIIAKYLGKKKNKKNT